MKWASLPKKPLNYTKTETSGLDYLLKNSMVKSKPLGEEVLTLFLTYRLSRQKTNTIFLLFLYLHIIYKEETQQSKESTCLHTELQKRRSSPCPALSKPQDDSRRGTAMLGDARGTRLIFVPCGSFGTYVAFWCPATFDSIEEHS